MSYSNESMKREICKKIFKYSLNNIRRGPKTTFAMV